MERPSSALGLPSQTQLNPRTQESWRGEKVDGWQTGGAPDLASQTQADGALTRGLSPRLLGDGEALDPGQAWEWKSGDGAMEAQRRGVLI